MSPGFTDGLIGTPNELKLKYIVDNEFGALDGEELESAMKDAISEKDIDLLDSTFSIILCHIPSPITSKRNDTH